jgi:hypothetical protein
MHDEVRSTGGLLGISFQNDVQGFLKNVLELELCSFENDFKFCIGGFPQFQTAFPNYTKEGKRGACPYDLKR